MPKQTGPRTAEGKAVSSQNALKHGLTSRGRMFALANENEEKWNMILKVWTDELQPRSDAEFMIVTDIAHAQWRIRRARTIECGMMDLEMEDQFDDMAATFTAPVDEGTRLACAFKGLGDKSRGLDHLHRYETRARRDFKQGLAALEQLRALTATRVSAEETPKPKHEAEAKPEAKPEPKQEHGPEPNPAPKAKEPVPAAVRFPNMPKDLRNEWDYLNRTIPNFDTCWHRSRMSDGLRRWIDKKAA